MISKLEHVRISPIPRIERIEHINIEPTDKEMYEKAETWPVVYPTIRVENFYDSKGRLLSASTINFSTYG